MRIIEFVVPLLLIGTLLYSLPIVNAAATKAAAPPPPPPPVIINIDTQGMINSVTSLATTTTQLVTNLPAQGIALFTGLFKGAMVAFNKPLLEFTRFLLSENPNPDALYSWWQSIVIVISSFYLLVFMIVGFLFIFSSISPEKRATAKEWLKGAFMMIIGVNLSFYIYRLILELATAITQYMWLTGFENFFQENMFAGLGAIMLIFWSAAAALAALTLFARYLLLMVGVLAFPIGIFLYYIPPLKNWGSMVFNFLGIMLFMQFVDVIIFVATNQLMTNLNGQIGAAFVPIFAYLIVAIVNIILGIYAVFKTAFSITDNSRFIGFVFGAISGQIGTVINAVKPATEGK